MISPTANITSDLAGITADRSVRFALAALTRRGAYLRVTRDHAELYSDRNGFAAPLACLELETFRALAAADWIELNGEGAGDGHGQHQWHLAKAGRDAVRRARAGDPPDAADGTSASTPSPDLGPAASAVRPNVDGDSPLAWLHSRRDRAGRPLLSRHAYDAGERLRADFWFAAMTPRVTASWSPVSSERASPRSAAGDSQDMSDNVVAARQRVRRALAVVGPELSGILIDICCHEKGIEDTERAIGWPVRSGRIVLQLALERLARHYGLAPPEPGSQWAPEGRIRAWGDGQHRPTIDRGAAY